MGSYTGLRRRTSCVSGWIKFAVLGVIFTVFFQGALCEVEPTESQCRPYIEKALKEQHDIEEKNLEIEVSQNLLNEQEELPPTDELTDSTEGFTTDDEQKNDDDVEVKEENEDDGDENEELHTVEENTDEQDNVKTEKENENADENKDKEESADADGLEVVSNEEENKAEKEEEEDLQADSDSNAEPEGEEEETDKNQVEEEKSEDADGDDKDNNLETPIDIEIQEIEIDDNDDIEGGEDTENDSADKKSVEEDQEDIAKADDENVQDEKEDKEEKEEQEEKEEKEETEDLKANEEDKQNGDEDVGKESGTEKEDDTVVEGKEDEKVLEEKENEADVEEQDNDKKDEVEDADEVEEKIEKTGVEKLEVEGPAENVAEGDTEDEKDTEKEAPEEEELTQEMIIPDNLRPKDHIDKILRLEDSALETVLAKTIDSTLKALKGLYDNAIKPLEMLYKYRDLSNRHFGDPEIFSKPLILFMGPWSGGKSSTINYLLNNEFSHTSLRTGAEPSPAYFNILMHGEEQEILDGTQLAADWTFSGLQKFGQSLLDRLKGVKLPNKLLEKVNIVEIPGILEIRKQVQRLFPFNDACQWFIDRADIIFLVYDPSKLDVGPETEAILDQLKGREYQTRIILNKADQVKPEELMRVQGTLIWNISPLMSSSEPPIMYSTSLWSLPYEAGAPIRLLQAQERAFLKDLREAIDKRVENKIASARRFAVRVRNHAKMVDCYLTTYYNHKSIFGNRKKISDDIIEYPQKYHIYEGLSTLTNISRYDLPDPDVYRDFFKINPLYEFKKLSETCTYFRGCPINKLDVAIAYDLPELVGKYRKAVETAKEQLQKENS